MKKSNTLFGITVDGIDGSGTRFYIMRAADSEEARTAAEEAFPNAQNIEVSDAIELIAFQYDGLAELSTV